MLHAGLFSLVLQQSAHGVFSFTIQHAVLTMTIVVNQTPQDYDAPLDLQALLQQLDKAQQPGIAVAVNNTVIAKAQWPTHQLKDQDHVTIITATQGG